MSTSPEVYRKIGFSWRLSHELFLRPLIFDSHLLVLVRLKSTGSLIFLGEHFRSCFRIFASCFVRQWSIERTSVYGFGEFLAFLRENGPRILRSTRSPLTLAVDCAMLVLLVMIQFALSSTGPGCSASWLVLLRRTVVQLVSLLFAPGPRCSASGSVWIRRTVCVAALVATVARAVRTWKVDIIFCP